MQLIVELFIWFIIEVLFWGIMFWTGNAIISVLTLGKWKVESADRKKELKPVITALIGFLFWLGVGFMLITLMRN